MSHTFATKRLRKRSSAGPEELTVRVNKYDGAEYLDRVAPDDLARAEAIIRNQ